MYFVKRQILLAGDWLEKRRIDVAGARTHPQAGQRRVSHRRINRFAAVDRTDRRAVAEMAGDNFQLLRLFAKQLGKTQRNIAMAGAVITIAAHPVLFVVFIGDGVHISFFRHGQMEGVVVNSDLHLAGEGLLARMHACHHRGKMQRKHVAGRFNVLHNLGRDLVGHGQTQRQTMSNGNDVVHAFNHLGFTVHKQLNHVIERGLMRGQIDIDHLFLAVPVLVGDDAAVDADALAVARCDHAFIFHIDELVSIPYGSFSFRYFTKCFL